MIETVLYDYLKGNGILNAPIYLEKQKNMPDTFYSMEKTGSTIENRIYQSTFAIQSYADSMYNAATLNEEIINVMLDEVITLDEVVSVRLNSAYNYTDTTTKQYRYQAVFDIVHY